MVTIRLQRIGRKNDPAFRVVATDSKNGPKSGRFLEIIGTYTPKANLVDFKEERVKHWIAQGASVSTTVTNFLIRQGIIEGKMINALPRKSPTVKRKDAKK